VGRRRFQYGEYEEELFSQQRVGLKEAGRGIEERERPRVAPHKEVYRPLFARRRVIEEDGAGGRIALVDIGR